MNIEKVTRDLAAIAPGGVHPCAPMRAYTSFQIGGPADILLLPGDAEQARQAVRYLRAQQLPYIVMGNGTNLLVADAGYHGVVIHMHRAFSRITCSGTLCRAQAGVMMSKLARQTQGQGLSGLEFAAGIPGTLGGAVAMNAGAYGGQISDVVCAIHALDAAGMPVVWQGDALTFGYRKSPVKEGCVVLEVEMRLRRDDPQEIAARIADFQMRRAAKQPLQYPSAGSVFKRPKGHFAGALIEQAGLKGTRIGGAEVSEKHAGFIINRGGATARDVRDLIAHIQRVVLEQSGVSLQCEVRMLGDFDEE
nr:UDP-N-acetylmuramate dehydrogenase [Maliibacterium massiliense]